MVTVTDFSVHEDTDGRTFIMLKIEGGLSMAQSQTTGKFYMTVASAKIPCTFDEAMAQSVIGNTIPGKIVRVDCDPYSWTPPDEDDEIILQHRWEYRPEDSQETIPEPKAAIATPGTQELSFNGIEELV